MKTISTHLSYFLKDREVKRNLSILLRYVAVLVAVIAVFTVVFHFIMLYVEGKEHSWITGLYWTLTVMSTLGFGDITFQSDIGRLFSVFVLMSGIVMLLIVLPFAFIRFFYAPWLESQIRNRAPRSLPADASDHVILTNYDPIARGVVRRLERDEIPYVVLEPDPTTAANLQMDGVRVVTGDIDDKETYEAVRADRAQFMLANHDDQTNTNITLTVREVAPEVPVAALVGHENSQDILELSGATQVLPIKRWLGEQLATRITAEYGEVHPIGQYRDLRFAELPVQHTSLEHQTIREARIREQTGATVVGLWERGSLQPVRPNTPLAPTSVLVVTGTTEQLRALNRMVVSDDTHTEPVVVIGGGRVGGAAVQALHKRGVPVHLVEQKRARCKVLRPYCAEVFCGDAAEYALLEEAGIETAPSVLLTTHDDAINIHLASYCRRLNSEMRVVSRITHERNLEAIHRAGADFVLSYATLGIDAVYAALRGRRLVVLGEGVDLFTQAVPPSLAGTTLAGSHIGEQTGLNVVALEHNDTFKTNLGGDTPLSSDNHLVLIGSDDQMETFVEHYE
ncbi:potassium channel family protein [Salinibacter altiplanensis]|uniref:potassium channel family protein n=1 Tax=Salinibacter altiplanensis TaxID=1803181 RepID=UPI0018E4B7B7|nr:potassium channel family protein [Salinibacter altiplanensis]